MMTLAFLWMYFFFFFRYCVFWGESACPILHYNENGEDSAHLLRSNLLFSRSTFSVVLSFYHSTAGLPSM